MLQLEKNMYMLHPLPSSPQVMASEKQMATKFQAAQNTSDEWLRRAELAVRKGQDELAREALMRRKTFDTAANSLKVRPGQGLVVAGQGRFMCVRYCQ